MKTALQSHINPSIPPVILYPFPFYHIYTIPPKPSYRITHRIPHRLYSNIIYSLPVGTTPHQTDTHLAERDRKLQTGVPHFPTLKNSPIFYPKIFIGNFWKTSLSFLYYFFIVSTGNGLTFAAVGTGIEQFNRASLCY